MAVEGLESVPTSMRGIIVGPSESGDGWIANMSHPTALAGVELSTDGLCVTRDYANDGARTRLTKLHAPGLPVQQGDTVVAHVETRAGPTGGMVEDLTRYRHYDDEPHLAPEIGILGATAVRWGIRPKRASRQL